MTAHWPRKLVATVLLSTCGCQLPNQVAAPARPVADSNAGSSSTCAHLHAGGTTRVPEWQAAEFARQLSGQPAPAALQQQLIANAAITSRRPQSKPQSPDITAADEPDSLIRQVCAFDQPAALGSIVNSDQQSVDIAAEPATTEAASAATPTGVQSSAAYPVDLPTVLRLAGGRNWTVQLAWEQIRQAQARVTAAEALWLPSLNAGIGYTRHDGQIQATNGQVVDVSRNSLFVGGGAKLGQTALAGGSGGPARLFVDLPVADALFQPLVQRQLASAAQFRHTVEFNDALRDAALAYYDLVAAQSQLATVQQNLDDADNVLRITDAFVAAGKASAAETARVKVVVASQQRALVTSQLQLKLASTELIRLVRLDPQLMTQDSLLYSADQQLVPVELVPADCELQSLILQGQRSRPEVAEQYARTQARCADARSEELRPFIPNLNVGVSSGGFGGGVGDELESLDGRADIDALLVWEIRNLGFGEQAARQDRNSQYRQAVLESRRIQDLIAAEVSNAWHRVNAAGQQMDIARTQVQDADEVLSRTLDRIRGLEGLPLEAVQALDALANSRLTYLQAVVDHNKAQVELMRAIGRPISG